MNSRLIGPGDWGCLLLIVALALAGGLLALIGSMSR